MKGAVIAVKLNPATAGAPDRRLAPAQVRLALTLGLSIALAGCANNPSSPAPATVPVQSVLGSQPASSQPAAQPPAQGIGEALQQEFVAVVKKVNPAVVLIRSSTGLGSGVVFDTKGDIVTNAHVVGNDKSFIVISSDGHDSKAALVGTFPVNDIAVIKAENANLAPAKFGDSSQLVVGDVVLAIGNPLGLQSSVTEGIVSATGRTVNEPGGAALPGLIQTSAAINPGNSGGALVDLAGEVIGIPTLAAGDPQMGGAAPGIGFAIPSNAASDIARQLIEHGRVVSTHRAYLGIRTANVDPPVGALVYSVDEGGPAAQAGIKPGEFIVAIEGQATPNTDALAAVLANLAPGQVVTVKILDRSGATRDVKVTLGELPG
jgi:putative serine protease PepD